MGSDWYKQGQYRGLRNISIHAPRGGSDFPCPKISRHWKISIHAPRVGSDPLPVSVRQNLSNFNPRSPCGERLQRNNSNLPKYVFQSTLPVGGATGEATRALMQANISIHAPRGGSDISCGVAMQELARFQSTLPVWGATPGSDIYVVRKLVFQSTLPVWGATFFHMNNVAINPISIHAPRVGSDIIITCNNLGQTGFQSTLPVWGATFM